MKAFKLSRRQAVAELLELGRTSVSPVATRQPHVISGYQLNVGRQ
ncbi:MAG: hypothetical protein WBE53_02980 [Pseudolabrys sp.]|jgi:hypothetical protein